MDLLIYYQLNGNADVVKVRLQMQLVGRRGPLHGMVYLFKLFLFMDLEDRLTNV